MKDDFMLVARFHQILTGTGLPTERVVVCALIASPGNVCGSDLGSGIIPANAQ